MFKTMGLMRRPTFSVVQKQHGRNERRLSEIAGRRVYYLAAVAIVAIVLISAIAVTRPVSVVTSNTGNAGTTAKTIQVSGVGTVTSDPDEAKLLLAVLTQADTANQATSENAATISNVTDALVNAGLSKDSIQTTSYTLTPLYENKPDGTTPPRIVGYAARNAIAVTLTDFKLVGKALDAAIAAGTNEVQGVLFTFSDGKYAALQNQALKLAVQNADSEAKALASTLNINIIGPISVTPGYTFQPTLERVNAGTPQTQTTIQPGTLEVTATVQVTYQFA
jgi:uncharacterized protein YggE